MKKIFSLITGAMMLFSFSLTAFAAPVFPSIQLPAPGAEFSAVMEAAIMDNITCSFTASIKYVDATKNTVTYSMNYINKNESTVKKPYGLQVGGDAELYVNLKGELSLAPGTGKLVFPSGRTTSTVTVNPKTTTKVAFNGNINGKKCTSKELTTLKAIAPLVTPIDLTKNMDLTISGSVAASGTVQANDQPAQEPAPAAQAPDTKTCKIIAEGTLKGTTVLMGAAIDYDGYDPKLFPFTVRGYSESKPNDVREYKGNQQLASGHNYVLNSDNRGFLFELPLSESPETYIITGSLGGKDCALASFAIPSMTAIASAQNTSASGGTLGTTGTQANSTVEVFGSTPQDAQVAAQLALADTATSEGAQDSSNSLSFNILLVLSGILGAAIAYGLYRKFAKNS